MCSPEKITVLSENLEELEHLGLALAVLVRGVGLHYVVKTTGCAGSNLRN